MKQEANFASILEQIIPVEVNALKHYEDPSRFEISRVVYSLTTTGFLRNPIVVDVELGVLIDGHHRAEAYRWLGFSKIPAFTVSYFSDAVQVGGWNYTVDAPEADIQTAFKAFATKDIGSFGVIAKNPSGREIAASYHEHPISAARYLEHVNLFLSAGGYPVEIVPDTDNYQLNRKLATITLSEPLGKDGVMDAISHGLLYPQQVNRHLVDCRPLALNFPLYVASYAEEFRQFCEKAFVERRPHLVAGPCVYDGRFYEERTLQFEQPS